MANSFPALRAMTIVKSVVYCRDNVSVRSIGINQADPKLDKFCGVGCYVALVRLGDRHFFASIFLPKVY